MKITCPRCNTTFNSGFNFVNSYNVTLQGNRSQCPNCGSMVSLPEGTFNFDKNGLMTILSGPEFTPEVLDELQNLTEKAKEENYSPDEYKQAALQLSPAIAQLFTNIEFEEKFWKVASSPITANFLQLLGVIIAVIAILKSRNSSSGNVINITNNYYKSNSSVKKIHPNKKCFCGSNRKFKNCHGNAV